MVSIESIVNASYGAAEYDTLMSIPNKDTLECIRQAGVERFLPKWVDFTTGEVRENLLREEIQAAVECSYLPPPLFLDRYRLEPQNVPPSSVLDLNYLLVKEIIAISPTGKVNSLVYKMGTARVNQKAGMDTIKRIYDQDLTKITDSEAQIYWRLLHHQLLQDHQRFIDELPLLETIIKEEDYMLAEDISTLNIAIFFPRDSQGKPLPPQNPFL